MSADAFHVCYGLRWEVDADSEEELAILEQRRDPRQLAARSQKLQCWWGTTSDENRYFVLVGKIINFGWENKHAARLDDAEVAHLVNETRQKLLAAGFDEPPAWHFQFEADF